jgi:hypothetical protein
MQRRERTRTNKLRPELAGASITPLTQPQRGPSCVGFHPAAPRPGTPLLTHPLNEAEVSGHLPGSGGDAANSLGRRQLVGRRSKSTGRLLYGLWRVPGCLWGEPGLIQNLSLQGLIDVGLDQVLKRISRLVVFPPATPRPILW